MTTQNLKRMLLSAFLSATIMTATAQDAKKPKQGVKSTNIGVTYNLMDFDTKSIFPKEDSAYGFSVLFMKGISSHFDYSFRYNGAFPNKNRHNIISKNAISSELEAAIHGKMFPDKALLNPFLTLGIGGGNYHKDLATGGVSRTKTNTWNAHALGGGGIQLNIKNELYFLAQAHYRYSFNENRIPHNLFYSFGLSRSITRKKEAPKPVVVDRDNDGVLDNVDACPDVPGLAALQGCPDRDGDGIADKDDACPDVKGLAKFNGCPDSDNDGIADNDDKCPTEAGIAKYQGCPIPDTDKDGINDENDKCPTVPGIAKYQGCPMPDADKDGVADEDDRCPNLAGVPENQGCPIISEEVKTKVNQAANKILFVTGSAKLQSSSYKGLNEVVKIMSENPEMTLAIDGHTDNVGTDEKNMVLSQNRANSVKTYLVSKGIAADRISATGHGETTPIADNNTAAGRQQNRRSELTLSYFK